ncbi:hypothetical protein GCM10009127_16190 [Alteraurantiacibacter aestuarii]|uniref:Uncharacterized protein n=1 Tax=Alteraurantiacibacter aestuarii TaxID=650004 RepID=A0A844ZJ34_9SPHN|nr:hypothetical protein [Alteraurantiacibacter aestuarii]MXO87795.1 hypothetical protein [Alteraurantiacibacter aestuarii]
MKSISKALAKGTIATVAAGALAVGMAAPANAQDRNHRNNNHISTGEVIAGAVILGGLAAVIASSDNNRRYDDRRYDDRRYNDRDYNDRRYNDRDRYDDRRSGSRYGYNGRGNPDRAVEQCVRAAERQAERWGGGRADVTQIRDVERERGGFEVTGRIAVRTNDYRGRNSRNRGWDEGRFTCDFRRGRVVDIDYRGIRGL